MRRSPVSGTIYPIGLISKELWFPAWIFLLPFVFRFLALGVRVETGTDIPALLALLIGLLEGGGGGGGYAVTCVMQYDHSCGDLV